MSEIIVAPETRDLDELGRTIVQWMGKQMPEAQGIRVDNLSYPKGAGQSHETVLYDAQWTEQGVARSQGHVVRIKPTWFTVFPDDLFEQQYRLMKVIHDGDYLPVARPVWYEEDPTVLGAPFFVMEKMVGRVPVSIPPYAKVGWVAEATPAQRTRIWENGVRQLAAVQSVPTAKLDFLKGKGGELQGLAQEWDKYSRFVEWVRGERSWPVLEAGRDRLRDAWPDNQPAGLVWGDARLGNLMFNDEFDVIAVMDWEQPSLGGALNDLGWWLVLSETMHGATDDSPHLEGMGTRGETLALWHELTGISTQDIEWYEDFTHLKMTCLGIRMAGLRGQPPPDEAWVAARLKVD